MTDKPTALRLADALETELFVWDDDGSDLSEQIAAELRRLHRECEYLSIEREHARIRYEHAVKLLIGIHSLCYPPATGLPDGRTMVFRPKDPDPHEVLQELSDRIRALPDEIARAAIAKAEGSQK